MREYKFRGFDAVGQKGWVYGDLVHNKKVTKTGLEDRVMVAGYEVVPESVGMFTGLYDFDNKPIYEGDLIYSRFDIVRPFASVEYHPDGYFYMDEVFGNETCKESRTPLGEMLKYNIDGMYSELRVKGTVYENKEQV